MKFMFAQISRIVVLLAILLNGQSGLAVEKKTASDYYQEGSELFKQGCQPDPGLKKGLCAKAIAALEQAIQLNPESTDAYFTLARAYWNQSILESKSEQELKALREKVAAIYRKVISIDPNNAKAYYKLSAYTEDKNEALSLLQKLIELHPKHPEAHRVLAQVLFSQGKVGEAVEEYRVHMKISPYGGIQAARNQAAFANSLSKVGRLKEAVEIYEDMLRSAHSETLYQRCVLTKNINLKKYREHKDFLENVSELRRYCTNLDHYDRAIQLINDRKYEEAIEQLKLQIKVNLYPEGTYIALVDVYKQQGRMEKASGVVKMYFEIHKDPSARCKMYRHFALEIHDLLDKEFIEKLKKECSEGENK